MSVRRCRFRRHPEQVELRGFTAGVIAVIHAAFRLFDFACPALVHHYSA
jgi:hypothetical protein